jgi:hypothetical protein
MARFTALDLTGVTRGAKAPTLEGTPFLPRPPGYRTPRRSTFSRLSDPESPGPGWPREAPAGADEPRAFPQAAPPAVARNRLLLAGRRPPAAPPERPSQAAPPAHHWTPGAEGRLAPAAGLPRSDWPKALGGRGDGWDVGGPRKILLPPSSLCFLQLAFLVASSPARDCSEKSGRGTIPSAQDPPTQFLHLSSPFSILLLHWVGRPPRSVPRICEA